MLWSPCRVLRILWIATSRAVAMKAIVIGKSLWGSCIRNSNLLAFLDELTGRNNELPGIFVDSVVAEGVRVASMIESRRFDEDGAQC